MSGKIKEKPKSGKMPRHPRRYKRGKRENAPLLFKWCDSKIVVIKVKKLKPAKFQNKSVIFFKAIKASIFILLFMVKALVIDCK